MKKMMFRSVALPPPSAGFKSPDKRMTRPDEHMSLREMIDRFVRGEGVPGSRDPAWFGETEDDLGKVPYMDLVDKQEWIDKQKALQKKFKDQEDRKAKAAAKKMEDEERAKVRARVEAEQAQNDPLEQKPPKGSK